MSDREPPELTRKERQERQEQYEENLKFAEHLAHLEVILIQHFEKKEFWLDGIFVKYTDEGVQLTLEDGSQLSYSAQSTPEEKNELLAKMLEINELMKARVEKEIALATAQGLNTRRLDDLSLLISQRPGENIRVVRLKDIPKLKWERTGGEGVKSLTGATGKAALEALRQDEK